MSGSWAPRTRLNGRDHAASCRLSTSPIAENQSARGTEQPRGKQDGEGPARRNRDEEDDQREHKKRRTQSARPSQGVVHRPRRPFRYPAGCRSSPGELPPQGPREGRTPPTLYSKAHALGDLGADIRPQTTLACAIPTVDGNLHLSRKVDGSLSSSLRTATRVPSRRLHRRCTRPGKGRNSA